MIFEQVVNQIHVVMTLKNAIRNNRIANAYLFAGPRGVGKTTIARILAKAINCQQGPTETPCNECASCTEITDGRSLDVFEIDGASNRGIDEVRNLRENLKYAPTRGKYKIYIIDEVHMLTTEAFNALLKTLEEPPSKVLFIFATTEPHKIPATILSRCQRFDFKRLVINEIIEQLKNICEKEKIQIDGESLFLISKKADGGMRDAQSLLDQAISFCGDTITGKEIAKLLGLIDQELFFSISDIVHEKDKIKGLQLIDEIFFNGIDLNDFLNGLSEHFRNFLIIKSTNSIDYLNIPDLYSERYVLSSNYFPEDDLLRIIQIISDAEYTIKKSTNPRLTIELALMKMIKLDSTKSLDTLICGIDEIKNQLNTINTQSSFSQIFSDIEAEKKKQTIIENHDTIAEDNNNHIIRDKDSTPDTSNEVKKIILEDVKQSWANIIDEIKKTKIAVGSFLNEGVPTNVDSNTLTVSFGKENGFHIKTITQNYILIERVLFKFFGVNLKIKCIKDETITSELKKQNGNEHQINDLIQNVPHLKTIIDVFDGEIIR